MLGQMRKHPTAHSLQAVGWDICTLRLVVNPVGQGTQARCFLRPGPYVLTGQGIWVTLVPVESME
jgi:hypothetical protein